MLELTKETFEDEVLKATGLVVVDYYGDGCVPCAALKPHYDALAEKYADSFKFTALNTSKARRVAIGQKILGLPVVAVYKDGEKLREVVKEEATPENMEAMLLEFKD
jgi:thioredoxin 1